MALRIFLTSPMTIECGDRVVTERQIGSRQVRLALAFLVVERSRPVSRQELADVLWPGEVPPSWGAAVRGIVSKVRIALTVAGLDGAGLVTNNLGFYQLRLPADAVVDIEEVAESVAAAEEALAGGDHDRACAVALAAGALARRPLLLSEEGPWVERTRAVLRSRLLCALEVLGEARLRRREPSLALLAAEEAVAVEPFRETAYRHLMLAHARSGNRGEALQAYARCRRLLGDELGVDPSPETEAIYLELVGREPSPPDIRLIPTEPTPVAGLPARARAPFVGRESELAFLAETWKAARAGHIQLVLLGGQTGIGKSALALEFATELSRSEAVVLYGDCDKNTLIPYQPIVEALTHYVGACPPERLHLQLGGAADDLAFLLPGLHRRLGTSPPPQPVAPDAYRQFRALVTFLQAVVETAPTLLVIDDLHAAAAETLMLLRHLVRTLEPCALMIVAAYRRNEMIGNPELAETLGALDRENAARRLALDALDGRAVGLLVRELAGDGAAANPELARWIWDESEGNPRFAVALLRQVAHALETGKMSAADRFPGSLPAPDSVADSVRQVRAGLSVTAARVLEFACVLGRDFHSAQLSEMTGLGEAALLKVLGEAEQAGLVHELGGALGHYRFTDSLAHRVIAQELGPTRIAWLRDRISPPRRRSYALELAQSGSANGRTSNGSR